MAIETKCWCPCDVAVLKKAVDCYWCILVLSYIPCNTYDFLLGNNVLMTSQLVFTSRELVKKKAGEWLATFTLFRLSPVTEKLLIALNRVSCTKYFMSIEIIPCSVPLLKIAKPDKKQSVANYIVSSQYDATMRRCWVTARDQ